jgi:hypothetical protein
MEAYGCFVPRRPALRRDARAERLGVGRDAEVREEEVGDVGLGEGVLGLFEQYYPMNCQ